MSPQSPLTAMALLKPLWEGFAYKSHQVSGIQWMLEREAATESGGLLCDEMGLGKTMEILGTIKNSKKFQTLLLCPKAVMTQWREAAQKSKMTVLEVDGGVWARTTPFCPGHMLYITNYEKLPRKQLFQQPFSRVVLDEAHRVKNRNGASWKAINALKRKTTWCVTATPVVNDLKDMRNLLGLVGFDMEKLTNYSYLCETVSKACLHRSMEEMRDILPELPAAAIVKKEVLDFQSEDEAEFYRGIQGAIVRRWKALESDKNIMAMFLLIMRLRQISLHPQVYINAKKRAWAGYEREDWEGSSTKFTVLKEKLEAAAKPSRWIVFCQFHDEMDILSVYLSKSPAVGMIQMYHGGLSDAEKEAVLKATHEPLADKHQVLLLQLQSGGVGLNLQHFSKVVFMSPWWTAALMDQAIGRAVRIGQKEKVEVSLLVLKEEDSMNIDAMMLEKVKTKRSMLGRLFTHASRGDLGPEEEEDPK